MDDEKLELEARVAMLEGRIEALEMQLGRAEAHRTANEPNVARAPEKPKTTARAARVEEDQPPKARPSVAQLVDKIGIALLLLGVGFLLKYSYDMGWLTETIRACLGATTGAILLATGLHQRNDNPNLSAVLLGGAVATFYGTLYASHVLYDLIPANAALAGTIGVTMLGFVLAVRQEEPGLASIATIGGFATPFVMEGGPEPLALSIFATVVTLGTSAIYLFKGWRSLLLTSMVGGFALAGIGLDDASGTTEVTVALVALAVVALAAGAMPAVRAYLRDAEFGTFAKFVVPIAALLPLSMVQLWDNGAPEVFAAALSLLVVLGLVKLPKSRLTYTLLAAVLGAAMIGVAMGVEALAFLLLGSAVVWAWLAKDKDALLLPALATLNVAGLWSLVMLDEASGDMFATGDGLLLVFSTAAVTAIAFSIENRALRWFFFYVATFAGMATLASQMFEVHGMDVVVTSLWGLLSLAMLVAGFVRDDGAQQGLGIVTVLLTAGKLLFVDLEAVDTILRVGIFMAMGVALLLISYMVPKWANDAGLEAGG